LIVLEEVLLTIMLEEVLLMEVLLMMSMRCSGFDIGQE